MLETSSGYKVYLACEFVDMRKSIDGLAAIVQEGFELDPFSNSLFVFCNKKRDKIKILKWDTNGFWLYYKRLEKQRFLWPTENLESVITITNRQLHWLLDGLDVIQPKAHKKMNATLVI